MIFNFHSKNMNTADSVYDKAYEYYSHNQEKIISFPSSGMIPDEDIMVILGKPLTYDELDYEDKDNIRKGCGRATYKMLMRHAETHPEDSMLWFNPKHREEDQKRILGRTWEELPSFQQAAYKEATYDLEYYVEVYVHRNEF